LLRRSTEPVPSPASPPEPNPLRADTLAGVLDATPREARSYFEASFHSSPALMSIASAVDGKLLEVNPAFARGAGYEREELIGRTTLELGLWLHPEQRDEFLRRIRTERVIRDMEADFRGKSGRVRSLLLNADLLMLGGQPCMLTVAIDITDRRRQERLQAATYQISQVALGGADLPTLFAEVHRIIAGLMSARNMYVALASPDGATISFPYFVDETMPPPEPRTRRNGVTEFVLDTGEPLLALDAEIVAMLAARGHYVPSGNPCAQWMGVPLKIGGRAIGMIALQDYHNPQAYDQEHLKLLAFVADQTAAAIHRRQVETDQREARAYFEKSFHSSPALMVISRIGDRRITEGNPAFLRACGYTREEIIGRTADDLNLWVQPEQRAEFLRRMRDPGAIRDLEADFRAKSGEVRTFLVHGDVLELGGTPSLLTVGIDITDRRRREKVQAATFQISRSVLAGGSLETLFAEVHAIIAGLMPAENFYVALASADGREIAFPYFVDEHVAPPPPRPLGNGFTEFVLQSGRPQRVNAAELQALLRKRGNYQPLPHPAAQRIGVPLLGVGRALGVIALQNYRRADAYGDEELRLLNFVAEQVAVAVQRHQAEAALARAEQRYRSIFENAVEGLYVSTPEGRFVSANPAMARMLGYDSPAELLAAVNDIQRQVYVQKSRREDFFALIRQSDRVADFESEVFRRDGSTVWVSESVRVVRNAQGVVDHFEGMATDITAKREAARALQAAKEAADAASRAKSYFLASVSHELRTPLNGILGYTQILRRDAGLTEKQREGVRVIHESADHLLALINDILDFSKIEAGRIELHPTDFDLPAFARGVEGVFMPRAREKSILFETALAGDLPSWVRGDEQRLRQVVFNLVSNAVKFTRTGGVVFSVQAGEGGAMRFAVSDTGPGISAEDQIKLFEPFTQVGNHGGPSAGGTGLGLAISRSLVERMGGRLQVESTPDRGSRFWFDVILPLAAARPAAAAVSRRIVGYEGERRRVLIVDDIAANRAVLVDMLGPLGFQLAEAASGEAALEAATRFEPHLVLMDLRLPGGIDGLEATRRLRRRQPGDRPKVIAVSASAYDLDRSDCLAAGCHAFLAKPFREEELWAEIARTLGLVWQHAEAEDTRSPFALEIEPPPVADAVAIYELAAKGDVVALRARAQALLALDPKYAPFAQYVLDLAARFKMKAIRQFVARYTT
jgi:PAS domain S-box-containing protein